MAAIQDPFGILLERKITASGIRDIFTPHTPVNSLELFFGRSREVKQIIAQINTPGQHSLLFGDRGVGKSSLANITSDLLFATHVFAGKPSIASMLKKLPGECSVHADEVRRHLNA